MKYSICKDSDVVSTVDRIKSILASVGMEMTEVHFEFPIKSDFMPGTIALCLFDLKGFCSAGKGANLKNAMASAYSEFMERIENQGIQMFDANSGEFVLAPDEIFEENIDKLNLSKYYDIACLHQMAKNRDSQISMVPFYNVKEQKLQYLPIKYLWYITGSNGMAAGNTPEEALVQGFSEVCERYAAKRIILDNIKMPDVPYEVYSKYEAINNLKNYVEQYGFEMKIKDASLGENLPVICTTFLNKEDGTYGFKFGASPSLPVAMERTFTEFMQGGIIYDRLKYNGNQDYIDRQYLFEAYFSNSFTLKPEQDKALFECFYSDNGDYEFSKSSWVEPDKTYSNKELLKFLLTNVKTFSDKDIFVRDSSFLGFPAFYTYIPGMSEIAMFDNLQKLVDFRNFELWEEYKGDKDPNHNDITSLMSALDFKVKYQYYGTRDINISPLANEYLMLLCYIAINDTKNIIKYCDLVLGMQNIKKPVKQLELMKEYFSLKNESNFGDLREQLKEKYSAEAVDNLEMFISGMNLNLIKQIIKDSNSNPKRFQKVKPQDKSNLKGFKQIVYAKDYGDVNLRMQQVRANMVKRYKENTPDQMNLRNVFDFLYEN